MDRNPKSENLQSRRYWVGEQILERKAAKANGRQAIINYLVVTFRKTYILWLVLCSKMGLWDRLKEKSREAQGKIAESSRAASGRIAESTKVAQERISKGSRVAKDAIQEKAEVAGRRLKRGYDIAQKDVDASVKTGRKQAYLHDPANREEVMATQKDALAIAGVLAGYARRAPDLIAVVSAEKIKTEEKKPAAEAVDVDYDDGIVSLLDEESFPEALRGNEYLLVDFYHNGCHPCAAFAPVFAAVAEEHGKVIQFAKVNTRGSGSVAEEQKIEKVPTTVLYVAGEEKARLRGAMGKEELERFLQGNCG